MDYRRIVVSRTGGPEVLELVTERVPEPGPGEALVRVAAAGVSFGDVLLRLGAVPDGPKPPFTPGYDVVGTVAALGPGVTAPAVGTRVAALLMDGGGYAEVARLPADRLVAVPDGAESATVAAAVLNAFAAHQMLHRVAQVRPGDPVLVHAAAGGLGTALLDLGRRAGLETYGTASRAKHDLVAALGAQPIDYQREDVLARVKTLTGDGVAAAFDAIGGTSFLTSHRALRPGGHLVAYGVSRAARGGKRGLAISAASFLGVKLLGILPTGRHATFYTTGSLDERIPGSYREDLGAVLALVADGSLQPVIADRLPLEQAARAHDLLSRAAVRGKIVLETGASDDR